ncbi:hypothetical protein C8R44DRAFT_789348 [Mycena epipterygia]|nr:hypothetical protein C8R44DRAFT_789348 [Mycena epipterygia]
MPRTKRKRAGADTEPEPASRESPPARKRARRVAKPPAQPIVEMQESDLSDAGVQVVGRKTHRKLKLLSESEGENDERPKKARRVKPPPATHLDSDVEVASDSVASPRKRIIRRRVEPPSDSDEAGGNDGPKRLRRVKSPPVDVESDSPSNSPRKGRLRRKPDSEGRASAGHILDSDDDPDDLALPVQLGPSKPTKKQIKSSALERYAKARKNKSSPAPVPADAEQEEDDDLFREFTPFSEAEESDAGGGEEEENLEESFIIEEEEGDADTDANAALDRMRYSHRELDEHFAVFVEYMIALYSDSEYLSTATEDEKEYFSTAVTALRRHIDSLADSMTLSTWKAPFIATLNLRPILADGVASEGNDDCHACWTRGMYSCDVSGSYSLSTQKGIYDPKTFQDIPEKKIKYGKATSFQNNAEARNLPYPPRFELIIGARCFNRALAYHEARHYLYNVAVRVKEKIQSLCEEDEELANDPNALLEAMKNEDFITSLWSRFKSDKKQWARWGNRKDADSLV